LLRGSTVRKFLRDVVGVTVSRGQLAKVIAKVSQALEGAYQELLAALPGQERLNVDETGHKDQGVPLWTWCFRAELYTLFKIDPRRSADVPLEVLGAEFEGCRECEVPPLGIGIQAIQLSPNHAGLAGRHLRRLPVTPAFRACCCPLRLLPSGKPDGPGTFLRVPPGCARDSALRLAAHTFVLIRLLK
jgi:hypothetical protein